MEVSDTIKITKCSGGDWFPVIIHSLEMPNGEQWDALNGWRKHELVSISIYHGLLNEASKLVSPPKLGMEVANPKYARTFETGATRDADTGKLDFEGFLSPLVVEEYANYMHYHRHMKDGTLRDSDNWQRGIPRAEYMKSAWRHFFDWWKLHRGLTARDTLKRTLCAIIFNASGYLHEVLKLEAQETYTGEDVTTLLQGIAPTDTPFMRMKSLT